MIHVIATEEVTMTMIHATEANTIAIGTVIRSARSLSTATMQEMAGWMDEVQIAVVLTIVRGDETMKADAHGGETVMLASTIVPGDETTKGDAHGGETVKDSSMTANEGTTSGAGVSGAVIVPSAHRKTRGDNDQDSVAARKIKQAVSLGE